MNTYKDRRICAVYETYDYGRFVKLEGNRAVLEKRIKKIAGSIDQVGYRTNPIIVNGRYEIIDGQGRFEACKEKGLPIQFVIDRNAGLDECIALNLGQTNWRPIDYVESYANQGIEDYKRFLDHLKKYPQIKLQVMQGIVENRITSCGNAVRAIKDGSFKFSKEREETIEKSLEFLMDLWGVIHSIPGEQRVIQTGIAWVVNNTTVNIARLRGLMEKKYTVLHPVVVPDMFLNELSDLYNSRLCAKNCIYFNTEYKISMKGTKENE